MTICLRLARHTLFSCGFCLAVMTSAWAQEAGGSTPAGAPIQSSPTPAQNPQPEKQDKRVFGVFPNYRTTDANVPFQPVTAQQKLMIGLKDSFDWPVYPVAGAFAALYQIEDQNRSFGQGMAGYARRYGTALGDQVIGNMMTESIVPSILHQDPRYFRLGSRRGGALFRTGYALSRIFVSRTDAGGTTFNFSEWLGNASAVAISNAYYPDTRTASDNAERLFIACATDAFSQVMKEFWPDVKRKLFHKGDAGAQPLLSMPQARVH
ncbi:MAG TPA: hypothetical protein VMT86_04920 [Bryobacteraceae bacterium]|nr:hypothetical protein [Bryobacteraceae bacterium]